jgi:hypothetical protein
MVHLITLSCPSCGGKLQISNDIEQFACGYCGSEHIVMRDGGIVALKPLVDGLGKIQSDTNRIVSELAIPRLKTEIEDLKAKVWEIILHGFSEKRKGMNYAYGFYQCLRRYLKTKGRKIKFSPLDEEEAKLLYSASIQELEGALEFTDQLEVRDFGQKIVNARKQIIEAQIQLQQYKKNVQS